MTTSDRTKGLLSLYIRGETPGERAAARRALIRHDPGAAALAGRQLVGAGPEPGQEWKPVNPAPLGVPSQEIDQ